MVILRGQNKITDFLMILAWASPFNIGYQTVFPTKTIFANNVLIYFFTYFGISELEVPGT